MPAPALKHLQLKDVDGVAVVDFVESGLMFEATLIQEIGEELHSLLVDHGREPNLAGFPTCAICFQFDVGQLARLARDVEAARGQAQDHRPGTGLARRIPDWPSRALFAIYDDQALRSEGVSLATCR